MPEFDSFPTEVQEQPASLVDVIPVAPKKEIKSDDIFYASVMSEGQPLDNYAQAKEEVSRTGQSSLVKQAEERWKQESDATAQATLTQLVIDETVDPALKKAALFSYASGGYVSQSLRDKYLIKQASVDPAITEADRKAQDIYLESLNTRDENKKLEQATQLINDTDVTFASILKGTAAVAQGLVLSIPAGYAAAFNAIKEQSPAKAEEIMASVQQWGWHPTDAGSQKVIQKISDAMEFIDIPFKWIGDKTLDFTDSPGAATAAYVGSSMVGYVGAFKVGKAALGKSKIDPVGPLGTTETANKGTAAKIAVEVLKEPAGKYAEAVRASKDAILGEYTLPKITDEFGEIRPDIRAAIELEDKRLQGIIDETEFNPSVAPVTKILSEREAYIKAVSETGGPKLLLSSSVLEGNIIESNVKSLKAKLVFGRNEEFGYDTRMSAEYAAEILADNTKHLPDPGIINIMEKDGSHFLTWEFNREYSPWEHLSFGEDALSAHFVHPKLDITEFANSTIGDAIWPAYMRMKEWVPSSGMAAGWKEARIEGAFLRAQRSLVLATDYPKELVAVLRDGESKGKLWKLEDVQSTYPNLKKAEAEKLHGEYVGFRRIQDRLYQMSNRKYRKGLEQDGYQTLYNGVGQKLGNVTENVGDVSKVSKVWDIGKQVMVDHNPNMKLVRLEEPVRVGDDLLRHAILPNKATLGKLQGEVLPKIPGYISRQYKEWFVLDKIPKNLNVDGMKVADDALRDYKGAVAMGKNKREIQALQERFQKEDTNHTYVWRKEQKDIQDKIIHDSKIYDAYMKETHKRGERLPALGREADVEDVIVAQTNAIKSASRITAWDQVMQAYKENWVKAYGDFSGHSFPRQINEIVAKKHMSPAEERRFLAAQKIYQQIEMQQFSTLQSDLIWKGALHKIADVFEKIDIPASALRNVGEKGVIPLKVAKAFGAHLWLYLRFARMWLVQPQQLLELSTISPSFAASLSDVGPLFAGLLARAKALEGVKGAFDYAGRKTVKEYDAILDAMESSGVMQAIDTNQMLHGIWRDSTKELDPKTQGVVVDSMKSMAAGATKVALLPSKLGRTIGYDPAELFNQVTLWMFSKNRWQELNKGKDWNTPENIAEITALSGRVGHMASTRAGMYKWQEGMISVFTQFAAIPFKSFMQMISSKDFTAAEKAKLGAARLFWYGKYGVPGGAILYNLFERNVSDEDKDLVGPYSKGVANVIANASLHAMFDSGDEKTNVDWSKSVSTVPDSLWFWDLGKAVYDMSTGGVPEKKFPFMNASDSLFRTARTFYDMFTIPEPEGQEKDWAAITYKAATFAGTMGDYAKSQLAEQISKSGTSLGHQQTGGEAIARLFGPTPVGESVVWEAQKSKFDREKEIKDDAKNIHERLMALRAGFKESASAEEKGLTEAYMTQLQAFLERSEPSYREEIIKGVFALDRQNSVSKKDSLMAYFYKNFEAEHDKYLTDIRNKFRDSGDPDMQALVNDLDMYAKNKGAK